MTKADHRIPELTMTFDSISNCCDGTITPQAPLIVWCKGVYPAEGETVELYLIPHGEDMHIPISEIYIFTREKIIVMLPFLKAGVYHPGMKVHKNNGETEVHDLLTVSWTVKER